MALLGLASVLVVCAVASAERSVRAAARETAAFGDAQGDGVNGLDIAYVYASPSPTGIDFSLLFVGAQPTKGEVAVWIDADANPKTGDVRLNGFDHRIEYDLGKKAYAFARWDGTAWARASGGSILTGLGGDYSLHLDTSDLRGVGDRIHFAVAVSPDGSRISDMAPDRGWWTESFAPLRLTLSAVEAGPVHAGGKLVVTARARRSDTGRLMSIIEGGSASCSATASGGGLRLVGGGIGDVRNGRNVRCVWTTAPRLKGKTVRGQITVFLQAAFVTRDFTVRVR